MRRTESKIARLNQIRILLLANPQGLTQAQIARKLSLQRSTVHRDLPDLGSAVPLIEDDRGRLSIDREADLLNVTFNLHEAVAIHLAARLLTARMERRNPHAAAALRKLAEPLRTIAPQVSDRLCASADEMDAAAAHDDPRFLQVLEALTRAWAERRRIQLWYRKTPAELGQYTFCPYIIEPYAVGQSLYTTGHCCEREELSTFKVEHIERTEMLDEGYEIPAAFDPTDLFSDAWGIWFTGGPTVEVVLKFSEQVARRAAETRWHRSQTAEPLADGSLILRFQIAEPQEMMPWLRGWGAECEVLAPAGVREKMKEEAGRLVRLYE